jgi:hypothetical protein
MTTMKAAPDTVDAPSPPFGIRSDLVMIMGALLARHEKEIEKKALDV